MIVPALLLALAAPVQAAQFDSAVASASTHRRAPAAPAAAEVHATRRGGPITIDGRLDEPDWAGAMPAAALTQRSPHEGAASTEPTDVRLLYDDDAIYIGARLRDAAPDSVVAMLARRDRTASADAFMVYLDPYHDRRTGVYFGINAAGTQYDGTLYNDDWNDDSWDGVWEGRAARDSTGWTAELRIPYSQLRFQRRDAYVWGINFKRTIARRSEDDYLVVQPTNAGGFVSRFADLVGIEHVAPPPRIEVMPYVTAKAEYLSHTPGDPFNDGTRASPGAGVDLKIGLGSNLTLDGTVNPDFGQVEVDPAVVNLTDVETFYPERRPFFVEGSSIFNFGSDGANDFWGFNWDNPQYLYSRRVGRAPEGSLPDAQYSSMPSGTHILGAAKLTGKVGSWSLGGLSALTKPEYASLATGGVRSRAEVEPLSYYGVWRAEKEFQQGRQGLGFIGTATARSFADARLPDELDRTAFTGGIDGWITLDRGAKWVLTGWAGGSRVSGTAARIAALEESSVHYYQRPDAEYLGVDSNATSLSGLGGRITVNKQKGNWVFNSAVGMISPAYELNDLGFQSFADQINAHLLTGYRWTRPGALFQNARLDIAHYRGWTTRGDLTGNGFFTRGTFEFRNFYTWQWDAGYDFRSLNPRRTRGGPLTVNPPGFYWDMTFQSDQRKPWVFGLTANGAEYTQDRQSSWSFGPTLDWRPSSRVLVSVGPTLARLQTTAQYVGTFDDASATATFGHRYLFAALDQKTLSASLRLNWIFTPSLSIELYAQPLLSSGAYRNYKELARPRSYQFTLTGAPAPAVHDPSQLVVQPADPAAAAIQFADPNFSLASLRGNAVLRWEYRPGSTLYLVWTQNRSDSITDGEFRVGDGLSRLFSSPGDNVFLVKVSYWWRP